MSKNGAIIELGFGYIFYKYGVVDKNSYSMYKKMGGGTHSAWRYNAFAKQCNCGNLSAWVKFECYIWGGYCIYTALLVVFYKKQTSYMAAQCELPLVK